jgi:dihydroorotase
MQIKTLTITAPDDCHLHLRDGAMLARTVADSAQQFARAVVMPNLNPPITTVALAQAYRQRILQHIPAGIDFTPLMTLYLTDETTPETIRQAKADNSIIGCKLYPAGATTNSAQGVTDIQRMQAVFATMQEVDLPLLIHGEVVDTEVDIFDREAYFIDRYLQKLASQFPQLRIVLEHITTAYAAEFIRNARAGLAATITPHHLLLERNDLLVGGIKPHHYCLPILKRSEDRRALITAAISGNPKFFLGTDSAPHIRAQKESACGCAGIYSAHAAMAFYAQVFAAANALDKLENFASRFGAEFYRLPQNTHRIVLQQSPWQIPKTLSFGETELIPLFAGQTLAWQVHV